MNRLLSNRLEIRLPSTALAHTVSAKYWIYENDLCIDVSSSLTNFIFYVYSTMRFVQCKKNLIDTFDDFGQFAEWDTENSEKPYSPYAKFFDDCSLSTESTVTVKEY